MRLRREHVVDVAIALLDADGLDALTMRKLATRLGVQAGALYWHFASKQALLDAMADRFLEDFAADLPAGSWDEQLAAAGWRLRQVLLSHRDGARVMAGRATFTIDVSMMTMKLATHAMARIMPDGTCGRAPGSAKAGGAAVVPGWDMTATPFWSVSCLRTY